MKRLTGQIIRLVGLALEVLGLLAQALRTQTDEIGDPLPGHFSAHQVWTVVGVGFVLWMIGSILIYWPRPSLVRRSTPGDTEELRL